MRICPKCGNEKKMFGKNKPRIRCRVCDSKGLRDWKKNNPEKWEKCWKNNRDKNPNRAANNHLKQNFGITLEEKKAILESQGGVCATCGTDNPSRNKSGNPNWVLDHNHTTKRIRGVLCHSCNVAIGLLKESPEIAEQVAAYLRGYSAEF